MRLLLVIFVSAVLACSPPELPNAAERLVGEYQLRSPSTASEQLLTSIDRVELFKNGTYRHTGSTVAGKAFSSTGKWLYAERIISLDDWQVYAGVTGHIPRGRGALLNLNFVIEFTRPPVIVVDSDKNIFYEKLAI